MSEKLTMGNSSLHLTTLPCHFDWCFDEERWSALSYGVCDDVKSDNLRVVILIDEYKLLSVTKQKLSVVSSNILTMHMSSNDHLDTLQSYDNIWYRSYWIEHLII